MHLYAALTANTAAMRNLNDLQYPNVLCSFAYAKALDTVNYQPQQLTLDSGAFTAWSTGRTIDLDAFADWALHWRERVPNLRIVNLDVIPGNPGRSSTAAERDAGMRASLANADKLRARGLDVMEVFHMDEPLWFLNELLDRLPADGVLCISPRNDRSVKARVEWLQKLLGHLLARYGSPANLPRTHGLAVTGRPMLEAFPFFSGDSSSWMLQYRYNVSIAPDGRTVAQTDVLPKRILQSDSADALGVITTRSLHNLARLQESMTSLWARRGVTFQ